MDVPTPLQIGPNGPHHAVRLWSTHSVASPERLDYWVGAICEAFLEMDCTSREPAEFAGR